MYLIDTNILIYYFNKEIPADLLSLINQILKESFNISIIAKMEFLGFRLFNKVQLIKAKKFIQYANILELTEEVAETAIQLRQTKNIKLPDAVIAGTAINNNLILVTRNEEDFQHIKGLKLLNPFKEIK